MGDLTIRREFASRMMMALLHSGRPGSPELLAAVAVEAADAVLAALAKDPLASRVTAALKRKGGADGG